MWASEQRDPGCVVRIEAGEAQNNIAQDVTLLGACEGRGSATHPNSDTTYEGDWDSTYEGDWVDGQGHDGQRHDTGRYTHATQPPAEHGEDPPSCVYEGEWRCNERSGVDVQMFANGDKYHGHLEDDQYAHTAPRSFEDGVGGGSIVNETETLLDELQRYMAPLPKALEWGTTHDPGERFGDLPPLSLISEALPVPVPVPVPMPVPVPAALEEIRAVPAKEAATKRPYNRSIDEMLWAGAEVAGWRRHATKHCAWVDPQGKYHESATAARRKWFATPEEAKAIAKRDLAAWSERNARRSRAGHIRRQVNRRQGCDTDGTLTTAGGQPVPLDYLD